MEKSEKCAGRSGRGSGIEEFDALWRNRRNAWPKRGGQEMENSMHYGEIGEMAGRPGVGSGTEEFNALWRNRRNALADQGGVRNWRIRCIMVKSGK